MSDSEEYCNSDDTDEGININDEVIDINDEISDGSEYEDEKEYREMINSNINSKSLYEEDSNLPKKEKKIRIRKVKEKKLINYLEKDKKPSKKFLSKIKNRKAYKNMFNPRLPPLEELQNTRFNTNDSASLDINDSPQDYPSLN